MKNNTYIQDESTDEIINSLIKLPIKNLEKRIINLQNDIKGRQKIFDSSLTILGTREIEIESHLRKMKYCLGNEIDRKLSLERELTSVKSLKINNAISHFLDTQRLSEKLLLAQEQLAHEKEKRKLAGS